MRAHSRYLVISFLAVFGCAPTVLASDYLDLTPTAFDQKLARCLTDKKQLQKLTAKSVKISEKVLKKITQQGIRKEALAKALAAFNQLDRIIKNKKYFSILDYSLPANKKRLFIVNTETGEVFTTFAAHGKGHDKNHDRCIDSDNKGKPIFSNEPNSKAASRGVLVTGGFYQGKHGKSLIFHGLQQDLNDKACMRSIVMHQAVYIPWGRSWGCPAVSFADRDKVFAMIAHGSLFYVAGDKPCTP